MLNKRLLFFMCVMILCSLVGMGAKSAQVLWPVDSVVFERIGQLYRVHGKALPAKTGPFSQTELQSMFDGVDSNLDGPARLLHRAIDNELHAPGRFPFAGQAAIDMALDYAMEAYLHINDDGVTAEDLWYPRWQDRLPILRLPVSVAVGDFLAAHVEFLAVRRLLDFTSGPVKVYAPVFSTNHTLTDFFQLDFNWPYRAVAAIGGSQWSAQVGRDRLSLGPGRTGQLLLSDHMPYHDYLLFKTWFGPFTLSTALVGFPTPAEMGTGDDTVRALMTHRLDWNITPAWHLAVTEAMMYQDKVLDWRFINPMMIYHQYFMADRSNSFLTVELWGALLDGLSLHGQFAVDDVRFFGESATIPNAFGWQLGLEYGWLDRNGSYVAWMEHVHTDPYLYMRDGIDYIVAFKAMSPSGGVQYVREYLGYPLGGDANVIALGFEWDSLAAWSAFAKVEYAVDGAVGFDDPYPPADADAKTPTGIAETSFRATAGTSLRLSAGRLGVQGSTFSLQGSLSYLVLFNQDNQVAGPVQDLQCSLAIGYTL